MSHSSPSLTLLPVGKHITLFYMFYKWYFQTCFLNLNIICRLPAVEERLYLPPPFLPQWEVYRWYLKLKNKNKFSLSVMVRSVFSVDIIMILWVQYSHMSHVVRVDWLHFYKSVYLISVFSFAQFSIELFPNSPTEVAIFPSMFKYAKLSMTFIIIYFLICLCWSSLFFYLNWLFSI